MPPVDITVTQVDRDGVVPAAATPSDQTNGHTFDNPITGPTLYTTWLEIANRGTSPRTVTVVSSATFDGLPVDDVDVVVPAASKASHTTALTGTNNDMVFTADKAGPFGDEIRIRYVVSGTGTSLSVDVVGTDITVNVATDGSGNPTSTAADIKTALEADPSAAALIDIANDAGNDGSGVVAAFAYANLSGGAWGEVRAGYYSVSTFGDSVSVQVPVDDELKLRAFRL